MLGVEGMIASLGAGAEAVIVDCISQHGRGINPAQARSRTPVYSLVPGCSGVQSFTLSHHVSELRESLAEGEGPSAADVRAGRFSGPSSGLSATFSPAASRSQQGRHMAGRRIESMDFTEHLHHHGLTSTPVELIAFLTLVPWTQSRGFDWERSSTSLCVTHARSA